MYVCVCERERLCLSIRFFVCVCILGCICANACLCMGVSVWPGLASAGHYEKHSGS